MADSKNGPRVTQAVPRYFDGMPVQNWPPVYSLGTVLALHDIAGVKYARALLGGAA